MPIDVSHEPWKKYAAFPGQPAFLPGSRLRPRSWTDLLKIVEDFERPPPKPERPPPKPGSIRACGSHWAFSDAAVSHQVMVEMNDPDERENPSAGRLNRPIYTLLPDHLTDRAAEFFQVQLDVDFNPTVMQFDPSKPNNPVAVVHVEAGMKIAELYSFLDLDDSGFDARGGNHLGRRFGKYRGPWAMATLGGAGGQTVAGALQTGTHGGDVNMQPIVEAVVAMHLIGAGGRHYWIEKASEPWGTLIKPDQIMAAYPGIEVPPPDDELLNAAKVACGRFGIVYSLVLKVVRQYALFEDRTATTWSAVRTWVDNAAVVGATRFTSIVVNPLGKMLNPSEHSAYVTRRDTRRLDDAGNPPAGRAERAGANAGTSVTFDPNDPDARDSFLNRVCEGAHPILVFIEKLEEPFKKAIEKAFKVFLVVTVGFAAATAAGAAAAARVRGG